MFKKLSPLIIVYAAVKQVKKILKIESAKDIVEDIKKKKADKK